MRRDRDRLSDILNAIENIERYSVLGQERFKSEELIQTWMIHYLQIIGEAARSLDPSVRDAYSSTPWEAIIGFRNLVVHEYFRVDLNVVWGIVAYDLIELKEQIEEIQSELDSS